MRQGAGGEICALHRKELPSFWRKPRVAEFQRREFFRLVTVVTDDLDLVEERDTIAWQLLWREFSGVDALIEVDQVIGPRQEICTRVCEDFNVSTPPRGPHFKASAVFREGIRPLFVAQLD